MKKITGTTKTWLTDYQGPDVLKLPEGKAVRALAYCAHDMSSSGWTFVGDVTVTVNVPGERQFIDNKVESPRAEQKKVLAEAQMRSTEIDKKIQTLLAITYDGEAA